MPCEASCTASKVYWPSFSKPLLSVIFLNVFSMIMASGIAIACSTANLIFFLLIKVLCRMQTQRHKCNEGSETSGSHHRRASLRPISPLFLQLFPLTEEETPRTLETSSIVLQSKYIKQFLDLSISVLNGAIILECQITESVLSIIKALSAIYQELDFLIFELFQKKIKTHSE